MVHSQHLLCAQYITTMHVFEMVPLNFFLPLNKSHEVGE